MNLDFLKTLCYQISQDLGIWKYADNRENKKFQIDMN